MQAGTAQLGEEKPPCNLTQMYKNNWSEDVKKMESDPFQWYPVKRDNAHNLNYGKFHLKT